MRKKGGSEDGVHKGARREREESMHRKAAALAWFKHGRKGSTFLGNTARGGNNVSKLQNPLLHAPLIRARSRHQGNNIAPSISEGSEACDEEGITLSMCANMVLVDTPYHTPPYVHQASRFKAEALALQNSSSPSPSPASSTPSSITSSSHKQQLINMSTGQSLALLSLLPHHQSQKCFRKGYAGNPGGHGDNTHPPTTPWDCGSSLYDSFELLCLSNQLGRCLTTVNAAAATASSSPRSSSYSKMIRNLASNPRQGPSLQPSYIPRSLYSLPQFMIPNYLATKSSKKRSSLIHPIFSIPNASASNTPSPPLPAPPPPSSSPPLHSQTSQSQSVIAEDHAPRKKAESSGLRRVFNSLLKSLHMKEDTAHQKPKRSNLSEELEKLPKNRPAPISSRGGGAGKYGDPASAMDLNRLPNSYSSASRAEMGSRRSPTSWSASSEAAMESRRSFSSSSSAAAAAAAATILPSRRALSTAYPHHFRNEGFRTTSKPLKSVKWLQPGASQ